MNLLVVIGITLTKLERKAKEFYDFSFFYIVCDRKIFCVILFRRTAENNSKVWLINAQNTEFRRFDAEICTI